jgi:hypothetical protein
MGHGIGKNILLITHFLRSLRHRKYELRNLKNIELNTEKICIVNYLVMTVSLQNI